MAMHLKKGKPKTLTKLGDVAENYIEAHATDIVFVLDPRLRSFVVHLPLQHPPLHGAAIFVGRLDMSSPSV